MFCRIHILSNGSIIFQMNKNNAWKLTNPGLVNMATILHMTFWNIFHSIEIAVLKFRWKLRSRDQLITIQPWVSLWLGAEQATSNYLDLRRYYLVMHICFTRSDLNVLTLQRVTYHENNIRIVNPPSRSKMSNIHRQNTLSCRVLSFCI